MLEYLVLFTSFLSIMSGLIVIFLGDWKKFKLKYSAVALSTIASIFMFTLFATNNSLRQNGDYFLLVNYRIYCAMRNIAFIIFHIAIGRDAIEFKKKDRRKIIKIKTKVKTPIKRVV